MSSEKMLTRIGGLLRQAESTDNSHESDAFMAAAQRLATTASIDLAVARAHASGREKRATPTQRLITVGEPGRKGLRTYAQLFLVIAAANDVRCDIAQSSAVIYAYGFAGDIDACEALYSSLLVQMVRASDAYIKSGEYRNETTVRTVVEKRGRRRAATKVRRPVAGVTARLNFQLAYSERIGKRLDEARTETRTVAETDTPGTAIALRDKELELRDYYTTESKARGTWRGGKAAAGHSSSARRAGDRAARTAKLGPATELGVAKKQLP
ncbi:DUF2786 domain-containing protein [Rhodococcus sp. NPDC058521]|uniref:DUF2786 domain-containing protein n=1 Tax=Rhodococcus sp. NPDC058521 TaxID=3346536 RepID=UPI003665EAFA